MIIKNSVMREEFRKIQNNEVFEFSRKHYKIQMLNIIFSTKILKILLYVN